MVVLHFITYILRNPRFISSFVIISVIIPSLLACTFIDEVESDFPPIGVLFQDDFSDSSSGWDQLHTNEGMTDYENGIFRINAQGGGSFYISKPNLNFSDVIITVEATKVAGSDDNYFGVLCHYQDVSNYYFLVISSDGYYGIGKVKENTQVLLSSDNLLPSEEIFQGETTNYIKGSCVENVLTLYVNDQLLTRIEDKDFTSGDIGLIAGTNDAIGTEIHFDNFKVLEP